MCADRSKLVRVFYFLQKKVGKDEKMKQKEAINGFTEWVASEGTPRTR